MKTFVGAPVFSIGAKDEGKCALVFRFKRAASLTLCGLAIGLSLSGCFSQEHAVLKKTVLTINGKDISTQQFAERLATKLKNFDALYAKDDANLDRAKEDTVQSFLIEFITLDYADKQGIKIDKSEVDSEVATLKAKYPDDFAFRRALADENLSIEQWRKDLATTLLQRKVQKSVLSSGANQVIAPSDLEIKAYFEANKTQFQQPARVRLRQVVLEKEDDASRIMDELTAGGNLEKLARKFSIAPESSQGGDTGWIEKGTLDVFDQAFKMPVGTRSKILKSPYGWHIFEVLKKEPEAHLSLAEATAKIRAHLLEVRSQAVYTSWLEAQVRKSTVQRNDALIRAIKVTTRGS